MSNFKLAWKAFWAILKNDAKAGAWQKIDAAESVAETAPVQSVPVSDNGDALLLLSLLQREARFVDFVQGALDDYDDATIGGVSRKVHDDCKRCLDKYVGIASVLTEQEQSSICINAGFDPGSIKLTGHVAGEPPYKGTVQHCGWRATKVDMPKRSGEAANLVICPAEVEM